MIRRGVVAGCLLALLGAVYADDSPAFEGYRNQIIQQNYIQSRYFSDRIKLGVSYSFFSRELNDSPGFSLEYKTGNLIIGTGLHRSRTRGRSLARGSGTMMPFYMIQRFSLLGLAYLNLGLGTQLVSYEIDEDLILAQAASDYRNYTESVSPSIYWMAGIHGPIPFLDRYEIAIRWMGGRASVDSFSTDNPFWTNGADLSQLLVTISYYFPLLRVPPETVSPKP